MSTVVWQPLPPNGDSHHWTRVLRLHASAASQIITCDLEVVAVSELGNNISYEAISYRWGDPTTLETIICNHAPVKISRNLMSALRSLRSEQRDRVLWADSRYINQNDEDEKANQVARFGLVFSCASRVMIWLGDGSDGTSDGFPTLQKLALLNDESDMTGWRPRTEATENDRRALCRLIGNEYFERLWVIQEIVKARDAVLRCGDAELPSGVFDSGMSYFYDTVGEPLTHPNIQSVMTTIALRHSKGTPLMLSPLLYNLRSQQMTDSLDKIFAVIGLLSPDGIPPSDELIPNYRVDVCSSYTQAAYHCLRE